MAEAHALWGGTWVGLSQDRAGSGALGQSEDSSGGPRFLSPLPPCLAFACAPRSAASAMAIFIPRCSQLTPYVEGGEGGGGVRAPGVLGARVGKVGTPEAMSLPQDPLPRVLA